mmetsp:Transcript_11187/g.33544  ORF Transcript_11187/g.33544 Transcript_11187/m.33544 type:complete len:92 (+) Transcript_11187:152-427(+)
MTDGAATLARTFYHINVSLNPRTKSNKMLPTKISQISRNDERCLEPIESNIAMGDGRAENLQPNHSIAQSTWLSIVGLNWCGELQYVTCCH